MSSIDERRDLTVMCVCCSLRGSTARLLITCRDDAADEHTKLIRGFAGVWMKAQFVARPVSLHHR